MKKTNIIIKLCIFCLMAFSFICCGQNDSPQNEQTNIQDQQIDSNEDITNNDNDNSVDNFEYFYLQSDPKGIKITIADNVSFQVNGGSHISVSDTPITLPIPDNLILAGERDFIYPFTQQGVTYTVSLNSNLSIDNGKTYKWVSVEKTCTAGGGINYTKLINTESLISATYKVNYKDLKFYAVYSLSDLNIILEPSVFDNAKVYLEIVLGEKNWANTKYVLRETTVDLLKPLKPEYNYFYSKEISSSEWIQYSCKYGGYAAATFKLKEFPDYTFDITQVWADTKIYYLPE